MYNPSLLPHDTEQPCNLVKYGINQSAIDCLFATIVHWLRGEGLAWNQSKYINIFSGPEGRTVAELIAFHYDGPPEREMGSGGENNYCKIYLYDTHCALIFTGDNDVNKCAINFKYMMRWADADKGLLQYILDVILERQTSVFNANPSRFSGVDREIEHLKVITEIIKGVLAGEVIA